MQSHNDTGFRSVLRNHHFRNLWASQAINQTAQNCIHFLQIVLVERLTGSSMQLGVTILAFTLPGVLFSPVAGVVVDRWPKKWILVGSNLLRALLVTGYLAALGLLDGWPLLLSIYVITFVSSAVAQFFSPAEGAMIPLLVGEKRLLPANSVFSITLAVSQVSGLIVLGPLIVKFLGFDLAFPLLSAAYVLAALFVTRLPRDHHGALEHLESNRRREAAIRWRYIQEDLSEGWRFVATNRAVLMPVMQLAMASALVMILATLAPGFAARVLGMEPEDAVFVFAPAGVGMLTATTLMGRFGYRLRKDRASYILLAVAGIGFGLLGVVSNAFGDLRAVLPFSPTFLIMGIGFVLGFSMSAANILATTLVQENTPARMRGRVFALQFMLNTALGIVPMLAVAAVADAIGIPRVLLGIAAGILVIAGLAYLVSLGKQPRALPAVRPPSGVVRRQTAPTPPIISTNGAKEPHPPTPPLPEQQPSDAEQTD